MKAQHTIRRLLAVGLILSFPVVAPAFASDPDGGVVITSTIPSLDVVLFGPGDPTGDGKVNISDAIMTLRIAVGLAAFDSRQFQAADCVPVFPDNDPLRIGDGKVFVTDAVQIIRWIVFDGRPPEVDGPIQILSKSLTTKLNYGIVINGMAVHERFPNLIFVSHGAYLHAIDRLSGEIVMVDNTVNLRSSIAATADGLIGKGAGDTQYVWVSFPNGWDKPEFWKVGFAPTVGEIATNPTGNRAIIETKYGLAVLDTETRQLIDYVSLPKSQNPTIDRVIPYRIVLEDNGDLWFADYASRWTNQIQTTQPTKFVDLYRLSGSPNEPYGYTETGHWRLAFSQSDKIDQAVKVGNRIVFRVSGEGHKLVTFDVANGTVHTLTMPSNHGISAIVWDRANSQLIAAYWRMKNGDEFDYDLRVFGFGRTFSNTEMKALSVTDIQQ